jgi:hypothetical protein
MHTTPLGRLSISSDATNPADASALRTYLLYSRLDGVEQPPHAKMGVLAARTQEELLWAPLHTSGEDAYAAFRPV